MKVYQIWMEVYDVNDEDWYSSSGHIEYRPYSTTIYIDKNEANRIMNSIDKKCAYHKGGLSKSYCRDLYLREFNLKAPEGMYDRQV